VNAAGWKRGEGWGWIWGDDDQVGALNAVTQESILASLATVRAGRVFDLGVTVDRGSYLSRFHVHTEVLSFRTSEGLEREFEEAGTPTGGVSFNTSVVVISDHAGSQIDGLCHATFGDDHHWYNGYRSGDARGDFGTTRAAVSGMPPIILTGVLVDIAGHLGRASLDAGFGIGPDLLEAALDAQGTQIVPGEAVFVRTGTLRHWGDAGHDHDAIGAPDTAGLTLEGARWLVEEQGAILVGSDTSTVEVMPPLDGDNASPVHKYFLVDQGVHMAEFHNLEELARERVYRFCYVALTPKILGTTGGFALRPIAIV
jgi:kynurenine formamidase